MKKQYTLVLVSVPSNQIGEEIADVLINKQLAACVTILPTTSSIYTWKGETRHEQEALILIKTRLDLFDEKLIPAIRAIHPYEVPEILAVPITTGSKDYLEWMDRVMLPMNLGNKLKNL